MARLGFALLFALAGCASAEKPQVVAKLAVVVPAAATPAAKPVVAATTGKKDAFPTDWMKPGNIMKYDVDADPMANRIAAQKTDTEEARSFNLKHVDLLRLKAPVKKVENKTAVVAVVAAKPAEKQTKPQAKKDAFPTDWMKSGNIMKYDVDADPMSSRIENQQTDVQEAHTYNLKHVDLVQKKAPVVKAAAPVVKAAAAAEKVAKPVAATEKKQQQQSAAPVSDDDNDAFPSDWMSLNNVIKYDVDADPMAKRIESFEADVQQARTFNNKHVSLLQKKAPARNANDFLYVQDLA